MLSSPPRLDDRGFEDLLDELLARAAAHTPEWVPQEGDPGRTLLELFAWLADTVLYRANLVPERQRLTFLRLLGEQMRPARPARGLVALRLSDPAVVHAVQVSRAHVDGPGRFEALAETTVFPVSAHCYYKRALSAAEEAEFAELLEGLKDFHEIDEPVDGYITERAFDGPSDKAVDVVADTIDGALWIALLAPTPAGVAAAQRALSGEDVGQPRLLNVGVAPAVEVPEALEGVPVGGRLDHQWHISTTELVGEDPLYRTVDRVSDTSAMLTKQGVQRLALPGRSDFFGVLPGDVREDVNAGVGERPPRLDDPELVARTVAWLRLSAAPHVASMPLLWAGINAVQIDQRQTLGPQIVGQSDGSADQVIALPWRAVEADTLEVQLEEPRQGWIKWYGVEDLALLGRDDAAYELNSAEGTLKFGNGIRGRIPDAGARIRVASARVGGGSVGNLPAQSLTGISAFAPDGSRVTETLQVLQPLATDGGVDAESLEEAERRIPQRLKHRNRSVTADDFRALAAETPGVSLGRVEIMPRFMPQQRRSGVPGVVSVMVLPRKSVQEAPNPRPDRPLIEKVFNYLDARRPLATELYVIGCEYVPVALSVGITVRDGAGHDQVGRDVRQALKSYLWSLPPEGPQGEGWPLGRTVADRELEVIAGRVRGVRTVVGVNLFAHEGGSWQQVPRARECDPVEIPLQPWQLPELLSVVVSTDGSVSNSVSGLVSPGGAGGAGTGGIAIPVIPEVC